MSGWRSLGQLWWTLFLEWLRDGMLGYVVMPFVVIGALGLAFGERKADPVKIAVVEGQVADAVAERLGKDKELAVVRLDLAEAERRLQSGRVAIIVQGGVQGGEPELVVDPTQGDARVARLAVERALRTDAAPGPELRQRSITTQGRRYVDFLVPGFLAYMLFGAAVTNVGNALVQDRQRHLLKRYAATPMRRWQYLVAHALLATSVAIATVPLYLIAGRLTFGVKVLGNPLSLFAFASFGMIMLCGIGFLIGSRAQRTEQTHTLVTLISIPLTLAGGAFFSLDRFPAWSQPVLHALPLTALTDGMRGITSGQATLATLGHPTLVLAAWGLVTMAIALKIFRWK